MSHAIQLGPLLLPFTLLLVIASAGCTLALGKWLSRRTIEDVETTLWRSLLVGVACSARIDAGISNCMAFSSACAA